MELLHPALTAFCASMAQLIYRVVTIYFWCLFAKNTRVLASEIGNYSNCPLTKS